MGESCWMMGCGVAVGPTGRGHPTVCLCMVNLETGVYDLSAAWWGGYNNAEAHKDDLLFAQQ